MERATLLRQRGGRGGWGRPVAMALAWEVCGLNQREISRQFGVGPYAVSKASGRVGGRQPGLGCDLRKCPGTCDNLRCLTLLKVLGRHSWG
jgi:hypothetical protein